MLGTGMEAVDIQSIPFSDFFDADDEARKNEFEKVLSHEKEMVLFTKHRKEFVAGRNGDQYEVHQVKTFNADKTGRLVEFEPEEQSDGTQRIMDLIPAIHKIANQPAVFFIDEIDRSLHPSLIKELLRYYMSNPSQGQLIFTTHEANLLDLEIFRQDEIWFTEKQQDGQTVMYPLSDFKPRYDLDIQRGYLKGRFGAIPFLGNLKDLNWQHEKKQILQEG
jgi:AAA15 family ATPase/GTPase